jgi:hypothetical protein
MFADAVAKPSKHDGIAGIVLAHIVMDEAAGLVLVWRYSLDTIG